MLVSSRTGIRMSKKVWKQEIKRMVKMTIQEKYEDVGGAHKLIA